MARKNPTKKLKKCESCGNDFFETVKIRKFPEMQSAVIGQEPMPDFEEGVFHFLRCMFCGRLQEPNILRNIRDPLNDVYDKILDKIEAKARNDSTSKVETEDL